MKLKEIKRKLHNNVNRYFASQWIMRPYFKKNQLNLILSGGDPIRWGTIFLSIEKLKKDQIVGNIAECGVYKGYLSKFIHQTLPDRFFFLFDTFQGFSDRDSDTKGDNRFKDTSIESVKKYIGFSDKIIFRKGYFPETSIGLENERFAFVMIDFDKYEPTFAALDFFYTRVNKGGFIFIHDYNNPESNWACSKATDKFLSDKPEKPIPIPDAWGSVLFRKF